MKLRKFTPEDFLPALYRPGMYVGPQGKRSEHLWKADALVEYLNWGMERGFYNEQSE